LFFDLQHQFNFEQTQYTTYNLSYYVESMIMDKYNECEILEFIEFFRKFVDLKELMHVFIKKDQMKLVQWAEQ